MIDELEGTARLRLALSAAHSANASRMDEGLLHPRVSIPSVAGVAPGAGFYGIEGSRKYFRDAAANNFLAQAAITRAEVTGAGNVLAGGSLLCTIGEQTDSFAAWFVYRFHEGLIIAIETYLDEGDASVAAHN